MAYSRYRWFETRCCLFPAAGLALILGFGTGYRQATAQSPNAVTADDLIQQAVTAAQNYPDLEARVRLSIQLRNTQLSGLGTYQQSYRDGQPRFRYEWRLPGADRTLTWLQVSDGNYLWTRTDWEAEPTLEVVDLRRLRQEQSISRERLACAGGVPGLLDRLRQAYRFTSARPTTLGDEPVWEMRGVWVNQNAEEIRDLKKSRIDYRITPPSEVRLILSRDPALPLFPFRVEYLQQPNHVSGRLGPTMTLEFYEVRAGSGGDARRYVYVPGDQPFTDVTDRWRAAWRDMSQQGSERK